MKDNAQEVKKTSEAKNLLSHFKGIRDDILNKLVELGMDKSSAFINVYELPDFTELDIENVVSYYQSTKDKTILSLRNKGLSHREISKRLGGSSHRYIGDWLKKNDTDKKT